jgi:hypothetical protein
MNMEYYQKLMLIILAGVILLGAGALFINSKPQEGQNTTTIQKNQDFELLIKALQYGKNASAYSIEFKENTDGYTTDYQVQRSQNSSLDQVTIRNILSEKRAYFFNSTTVICVNYKEQKACDNVTGNQELKQYENFIRSKLPSREQIERNVADAQFLFDAGYMKITKAQTKENCREIEYVLDFSNATIDEGARFGIGSSSPKKFEYKICIDENTNQTRSREFNYTLPQDQSFHYFKYSLQNSTMAEPQIQTPQEIGNGGETLRLLYEEKTVQGEITKCLIKKTTQEKESCLNKKAIDMRMPLLCELAIEKRDQCLLSTIPVLALESSCQAIANVSIKEDCYIEMSGATRDQSYCQRINSSEKKTQCMQIYQMETNATQNQTTNRSTNQSAQNTTDPIAQRIFEQIG